MPSRKPRKKLFDSKQNEAFYLSRSKLDLFLQCPRCFYLDRKLGIPQPPGYPFSLNNAVDLLLKKEFDTYRAVGKPHPEMEKFGIEAVPFQDPRLETWRDARRRGIRFLDQASGIELAGGVDDVWINSQGELLIVDYKATAKREEVSLDAEWQDAYKRQMEVYQWLFRQNGFKVSATGYFVYCNGKMDKAGFDKVLEFDIKIIPYTGKTAWIAPTLLQLKKVLSNSKLPPAAESCPFCKYRQAAAQVEKNGSSQLSLSF